jgi:hypothetical protein
MTRWVLGVLDAQMAQVVLIVVGAIKPRQLDSKLLFGCPRARERASLLVPGVWIVQLEHGSLSMMYSSRVDSAATGRLPTPSFPLVVDLFLQAFIDYRLTAIVFATVRLLHQGSVTCRKI